MSAQIELVKAAIGRVLKRCGPTDHSGRTVMLWLLEELTAKDAIDPNIIYPGKHDLLDFIFPEE